jgi:hypothetical protein
MPLIERAKCQQFGESQSRQFPVAFLLSCLVSFGGLFGVTGLEAGRIH